MNYILRLGARFNRFRTDPYILTEPSRSTRARIRFFNICFHFGNGLCLLVWECCRVCAPSYHFRQAEVAEDATSAIVVSAKSRSRLHCARERAALYI